VNIRTPLITNSQSAKLMQPGKGTLNYPTSFAQPTAMSSSSFSQQRLDIQKSQNKPVWLRIITSITLNHVRSFLWMTPLTGYRRNRLNKWDKLSDIVTVCTGDSCRKRDSIGISYYMVLTAIFTSVCGIWACFLPPKTARTEAESTTAREKSILSAFRNLLSRMRCILSQTPAFCQSRSLRQQVIPEPHPISFGRCSQPIPVFSTKSMPVRAARSGIGFRPGYRNLLFFFGISGSMSFHNSLSKIGLAMSNLLVIVFGLLMLSVKNVNILSFC
jgi:hypothetical protein